MKSAEEGYYLDPGSIATDDEEGLLKDQSRTNSDNFFDIAEGRGTDSGSKDSNKQDNTKYVQLSNFSGLNSPSLTSIAKEGSVVSSLSSLSDHDSFRKLSEETADPPSLSGMDDSPGDPAAGVDRKSRRKKSTSAPPRVISTAEEFLIFQELFQCNFYPDRVKVSTTFKDKQRAVFKDNLRLVQEVRNHEGPIWTMKFSPNGLYLASGGQDGKIFVWCVASNTEMTMELRNRSRSRGEGNEEKSTTSSTSDSYAPIDALHPNPNDPRSYVHSFLNPEPYRVYEGHSGDVIDLSWSKSCFILSASVDKTIRLWHVTRNDCLQYFRHPDIVTAVEFHPLHDRYFVSGCFDRKLRVWDIIPDGSVRMWVQATDTITAVAFSPDGNTVAGGLIQGQVYFFEYESLKHLTQMDCKNHGGRYKRGAKVTGIAYLPNKPYLQASSMSSVSAGNQLSDNTSTANAAATAALTSSPQSAKESGSQSNATNSASYTASHMLVTTNDNRIRLCRLEDYSVVMKYKALKNETMQIKSQFSEDGKFIICGSDTGHVYIWRTNVQQDENPSRGFSFGFFQRNRTGRNSTVESFQDADDTTKATTVGIFAPIDAVHSFLASQIDYLDFVQQRPQSIGHSKLKQAMTEMEARDHREGSNAAAAGGNNGWRRSARMSVALDEADLCTRIIATADTDGSIRIYFRVNSANGPSAKTSTV